MSQQDPYRFVEVGQASYYALVLEGNMTASGELYAADSLTAAHRTLPFGTIIHVTNLANGKKVLVKVNDRGPFVSNRIIDLSREAARKLGMLKKGVTEVKIEVVLAPQHEWLTDSIE